MYILYIALHMLAGLSVGMLVCHILSTCTNNKEITADALLSLAFQGALKFICLSVRPSICLPITKTLTWLISSEVLMIEN